MESGKTTKTAGDLTSIRLFVDWRIGSQGSYQSTSWSVPWPNRVNIIEESWTEDGWHEVPSTDEKWPEERWDKRQWNDESWHSVWGEPATTSQAATGGAINAIGWSADGKTLTDDADGWVFTLGIGDQFKINPFAFGGVVNATGSGDIAILRNVGNIGDKVFVMTDLGSTVTACPRDAFPDVPLPGCARDGLP